MRLLSADVLIWTKKKKLSSDKKLKVKRDLLNILVYYVYHHFFQFHFFVFCLPDH